MPEWLFATLFVGIGLAVVLAFAWRNTKRQIARTLATRPNPTEDEFVRMMAPVVSKEASEFLWKISLPDLEFYHPALTAHPDDDMIADLPIDHDDISMDWPREWAESQGFHVSNLPDWPDGWPVTVRNYGRWLDLGPIA